MIDERAANRASVLYVLELETELLRLSRSNRSSVNEGFESQITIPRMESVQLADLQRRWVETTDLIEYGACVLPPDLILFRNPEPRLAAEGGFIFLSHATADDAIAARIRETLEGIGLPVWVDSLELSAGVDLNDTILEKIEQARHFMVVLSPNAINSGWILKEITYALKVQKDGYKVIPVLLPGVEPSALPLWFGEKELLAVRIGTGNGAVEEAAPALVAAVRASCDDATDGDVVDERSADFTLNVSDAATLTLRLDNPTMSTAGGQRRARATARLTYTPRKLGAAQVEGSAYMLTAPLGPIEHEELRWYLERYASWPVGVFTERADKVVTQLPEWGRDLFKSALKPRKASEAYEAWKHVDGGTARRFTIDVDSELPDGAPGDGRSLTKKQWKAQEAATQLLALPWELLHDGKDYLFQGARGVRVNRTLPNRQEQKAVTTDLPLRVLLVSPRPEDERTTYIDHRVSARPLVDALTPLGKNVELTLLDPPTFPALEEKLQEAFDAGESFHVVHFDGHGIYDPKLGLGALCFENPDDTDKLQKRRSKDVSAEQLAGVIRDHRIPLFFLEACQSAMTQKDPTASVAAKLLQQGVASVVAMSHSVLVETARRFVAEFYDRLMTGATIGEAMLAGQQALHADTLRGEVFGGGELHLHDWFVPVLFQEEHDPRLIHGLPPADVADLRRKTAKLSLGDLPDRPEHTFVGRSRELLSAERMLASSPYVVFQGTGGEGKTTLAAELARWFVETQRFDRAAFVCLDKRPDPRNVLYALGEQLVPGFVAAAAKDEKEARLLVERALRDHRTVVVFDNMDSVLPPAVGAPEQTVYDSDALAELLKLAGDLQECGDTRLMFTSRELVPVPFDGHHIVTGRLTEKEAIELVGGVLKHMGLSPVASDAGRDEDEIKALVTAVNCHARSLVLIAGEVGSAGVAHTTDDVVELMSRLHEKYPDDRERSLFASVELSLQRLPKETRERIRPLGVFIGGGCLPSIGKVLGYDLEANEEVALARQLIDVSLADVPGRGYLRLDPALGPYLLGELSDDEREHARARWAVTMVEMTHYLYQQRSKDPQLVADLTLLDLPNLVAALEHLAVGATTETVVGVATRLEALLASYARPKALARVVAIRRKAQDHLGVLGHTHFIATHAAVERLLDQGEFTAAVADARALLKYAENAGEGAYNQAAYDTAIARLLLGRALRMSGDPETALPGLEQAWAGFQALADAGDMEAARMAPATVTERGDCLRALGRLDEAATAYEESAERAEKDGEPRLAAVSRGQLGAVRMYQRRFQEALRAYEAARHIFENLREPKSVAAAWHQIGRVHISAGQYDTAGQALLKSLAIKVQTGDRAGEANTLSELGDLYDAMGRYDESARFCRRATDIYVEVRDVANEGRVRNNLADTLIKIAQHDAACVELRRAIECKEPFGHAAQPWKTWSMLCDLERAVGDQNAAVSARQAAVETYLAYRRAGGENQELGGQLCAATARSIVEGKAEQARAELGRLFGDSELPSGARVLVSSLQAILDGARDLALADSPDLDYDDAVEVRLLLESLTPRP